MKDKPLRTLFLVLGVPIIILILIVLYIKYFFNFSYDVVPVKNLESEGLSYIEEQFGMRFPKGTAIENADKTLGGNGNANLYAKAIIPEEKINEFTSNIRDYKEKKFYNENWLEHKSLKWWKIDRNNLDYMLISSFGPNNTSGVLVFCKPENGNIAVYMYVGL